MILIKSTLFDRHGDILLIGVEENWFMHSSQGQKYGCSEEHYSDTAGDLFCIGGLRTICDGISISSQYEP